MAKRTRSGLARLTIADIQREIKNRERRAATLARRRGRLVRQLRALEAEIELLDGRAGASATRPGPARNTETLEAILARLLKGKVMSIKAATAAVLRTGYRTGSQKFTKVVNLTFIKSNKFRRVGVGRYTAN